MDLRRHPPILYITALVIFLITAILPLGYMLGQFLVSLIQKPSDITNVLIDSRQLVLLGRSFGIALSSAAVAFLIGLPVAIILAAKDLPYRRLFYFLVLIPVLIPPYVLAGAWIHMLSPTGWINTTLVNLFGQSAKLTVFSTAGCALLMGISFFPVIAIIVAAGLSRLDSNLTDIARLYTGRWSVFWYSIVPQIVPHIIASICLVMIFVLGQYGVPLAFGGKYLSC